MRGHEATEDVCIGESVDEYAQTSGDHPKD